MIVAVTRECERCGRRNDRTGREAPVGWASLVWTTTTVDDYAETQSTETLAEYCEECAPLIVAAIDRVVEAGSGS